MRLGVDRPEDGGKLAKSEREKSPSCPQEQPHHGETLQASLPLYAAK
jgi:hypothetical protein